MKKTDVLIIGGGLSGLSLADKLNHEGVDFHLIEASNSFGGRISTIIFQDEAFDMGPTWYWPGQNNIANLLNRFLIGSFYQFSDGKGIYDNGSGRIESGYGFASMEGSLRVAGGMGIIIDALVNSLPNEKLELNQKSFKITQSNDGFDVFTKDGKQQEKIYHAKNVVLAIPPRIVHESIESELFDKTVLNSMSKIPTWMAGHSKVMAIYDRPYWRDQGFSGDGASNGGIIQEFHDASPASGKISAIFGFLKPYNQIGKKSNDEIINEAKEQLVSYFGKEMEAPLSINVTRWSSNKNISTDQDKDGPWFHPIYGLPNHLKQLEEQGVYFSSTETSPEFGGFLEGALVSSNRIFKKLLS